ncbi:PhoH family protein [Candidatus Palauibacter sp.]|uniref:PhoH family protein n=1 Tax=Candidatus Palauibacter sp. TaxID=3101350 RepID=UPI003AF21ABC
MTVATERRLSIEGADQQLLAGVNDSNLTTLARHCDIRVVLRHDHMILSGPRADVDRASPTAQRMIRYARLRRPFDAVDVERFLEQPDGGGPAAGGAGGSGRSREGGRGDGRKGGRNERRGGRGEGRQAEVALAGARRAIRPKSPGQERYLAAIRERDIVVGIGPAGTGKTYLAVAAGVEALNRKRVRRIILTRPAVEAGEALGFLPGDIREKVDPYLRPLYDALEDMMPPDRVRRSIEDGVIEVAPLAYMRGRTLSDAFLILDEAQNATTAQMKMFLTRLGLNSKTVITGDKTQIDLPRPEDSGLLEIEEVLRDVEGIDFVYFDDADVVRHRLVKEIIRAYRESER